MLKRRVAWMPQLFAAAMLALILAAHLRYPDLWMAVRNAGFDAFMALHPARIEPAVAIVDIDEASLAQHGPWPWSAPMLNGLIERVQHARPLVVGLAAIPSGAPAGADCEVASPSAQSAETAPDAAPPARLSPSSQPLHVVIGFALTDGPGGRQAPPQRAGMVSVGAGPPRLRNPLPASLLPGDAAMRGAAGVGALNVFPDRDGRLRRVPLLVQMGDTLYPSLVAEMLRVAAGSGSYQVRTRPDRDGAVPMSVRIGDSMIPLNGDGEAWLHYAPKHGFPRVSAAALIAGDADADLLRDRLVVVGVSAPGIGSSIVSPLGERLTPAEVHAQALGQLLAGVQPLRPAWAPAAELVVAAGGGLLLILISLWRRGLWLVIPGALVMLVVPAAYLLFARERLLLDALFPAMTITAVYLSLMLAVYLATERERRWVQRAFSRYVSPALVRHLAQHPEQLRLSGERRECSFIMTDLAGFTELVEGCAPETLVDLLNRYLDRMISVVFEHEGTIDRIVGDAVSVRFSAPVTQPDHAQRAFDCALAMDRAATRFASEAQRDGLPFGETRIGVHSGEVIVGNFGGRHHLDYRAFGDPVNTAARLESANRFFGTRLAISAATLGRCRPAPVRPIGQLLLKGKSRPISTFTPLTPEQVASGLAEQYGAAYRAAEAGVDTALAAFEAVASRFPDDGPTAFHVARLAAGQRGVVIALEK
jgi:adenylate cyclase